MRQKITAGAELDLLTREELRSEIEFLASGYLRPPREARPEGGANLNGAGAGQAELYVPAPGMLFKLTRLIVTVGTSVFTNPYTGSGGIDVLRGSGSLLDLLDGTTFSALPQVATWSRINAPVVRDGERLVIGVSGGPANGQMVVRGMGILEPLGEESSPGA